MAARNYSRTRKQCHGLFSSARDRPPGQPNYAESGRLVVVRALAELPTILIRGDRDVANPIARRAPAPRSKAITRRVGSGERSPSGAITPPRGAGTIGFAMERSSGGGALGCPSWANPIVRRAADHWMSVQTSAH